MKVSNLAVVTLLSAQGATAFVGPTGLVRNGFGGIRFSKSRGKLQMADDGKDPLPETSGGIELGPLSYLVAPIAALAAGRQAMSQREELKQDLLKTETSLEEIKKRLQGSDTLVTGSFATAALSFVFVIANYIGVGGGVSTSSLPTVLPTKTETSKVLPGASTTPVVPVPVPKIAASEVKKQAKKAAEKVADKVEPPKAAKTEPPKEAENEAVYDSLLKGLFEPKPAPVPETAPEPSSVPTESKSEVAEAKAEEEAKPEAPKESIGEKAKDSLLQMLEPKSEVEETPESEQAKEPEVAKTEEVKKEPEVAKTEEPKKEPEVAKTEEPKKEPEVAKTEEPKKEPEVAKTEEPKKEPEVVKMEASPQKESAPAPAPAVVPTVKIVAPVLPQVTAPPMPSSAVSLSGGEDTLVDNAVVAAAVVGASAAVGLGLIAVSGGGEDQSARSGPKQDGPPDSATPKGYLDKLPGDDAKVSGPKTSSPPADGETSTPSGGSYLQGLSSGDPSRPRPANYAPKKASSVAPKPDSSYLGALGGGQPAEPAMPKTTVANGSSLPPPNGALPPTEASVTETPPNGAPPPSSASPAANGAASGSSYLERIGGSAAKAPAKKANYSPFGAKPSAPPSVSPPNAMSSPKGEAPPEAQAPSSGSNVDYLEALSGGKKPPAKKSYAPSKNSYTPR